ncbi:MAG: hypothetical protein H0T61_05170 [Actinobacteria bacterium]|nr:hypothetical protein [Actinomycetota bacterium]
MALPTHSTLTSISGGQVPYSDATWRPIRNHFGITAFGINAYTAARAGDSIIGDHDHADPSCERHQELYFVHAGAARFVVDGMEIDAPAGTFVSAHDVATRRSATALTDGTVVLVVGAEAGAPFEITSAERGDLASVGFSPNPA